MLKNIELLNLSTERKRNYLVSEPNYHTRKFFPENLFAIEMKKKEIIVNKPVYLGFSILELSKILTYEFWYNYVNPKYGEKAKLYYMDTDSFQNMAKKQNCIIWICIKIDDIYKYIAEDVETRFKTSNYY